MDFIAIDFETATTDRKPCQLGLVVVRSGRIVEEKQWLIKPPGNEYDRMCINVHGIRPEDTINEREFYQLWDEIRPYFENRTVVAHNRSFDRDVLEKVIEYYDLQPALYDKFECTKELFCGRSLEDVTTALGIDLCNHHDALCDARACAEIYLQFLSGVNPFEMEYQQRKEKKYSFKNYHEKTKLSTEAKHQSLETVENINTPFYDKKIVISGLFERFLYRETLAFLLKSYGADVNTSLSTKTDYLITGKKFGISKMQKVNELQAKGEKIKIMDETQLYNILDSIN